MDLIMDQRRPRSGTGYFTEYFATAVLTPRMILRIDIPQVQGMIHGSDPAGAHLPFQLPEGDRDRNVCPGSGNDLCIHRIRMHIDDPGHHDRAAGIQHLPRLCRMFRNMPYLAYPAVLDPYGGIVQRSSGVTTWAFLINQLFIYFRL
jgi:hypothetical protein